LARRETDLLAGEEAESSARERAWPRRDVESSPLNITSAARILANQPRERPERISHQKSEESAQSYSNTYVEPAPVGGTIAEEAYQLMMAGKLGRKRREASEKSITGGRIVTSRPRHPGRKSVFDSLKSVLRR
jgi:hypothetical protein